MNYMNGVASIALVAITAAVSTTPSLAQSVPSYAMDLPSQSLEQSLKAVARLSGREIFVSSRAVSGLTAPALKGTYSLEQALAILTAGTDIHASMSGTAILIGAVDHSLSESGDPDDLITVTGTRIRGGHPTSPVLSISRSDMADAGQTDLGQVARSIPQSFGGGQNATVTYSTPGAYNQNFNSASTINLRGLGSDATLSLINGHRMAYDGASQAIDLSAIPIAAIERLEVVADGSSAIYGSDAVGGVANIILRKDYDGGEAGARVGGATEGGDFQQQYDLVAGKRWDHGGFIATYDFQRATRIDSAQRSFTLDRPSGQTLQPELKQHSAIVSAHQDLADFSASVDATFNWRRSALATSNDGTSAIRVNGNEKDQLTKSVSVAPRLDWRAPVNWVISLSGVYGWDRSNFDTQYYLQYQPGQHVPGFYIDQTKIAEVGAEGPLFRLLGGNARLAIGAGYRDISLRGFGQTITSASARTILDFDASRTSKFGYGELYLPFISPANHVGLISRLEVTAALRYEDYRSLGHAATPKFGVNYAPVEDLTFKASWGRSFKTPTLYQQYNRYGTVLFPAALLGASGVPATATALVLSGGSPNLTPERSSNWTAGFEFRPRTITGLSVEISYFGIRYRDRITIPSVGLATILSNQNYQALVNTGVTAAQIAQLVTGSSTGLTNASGSPFNPTNVLAVIDMRYRNLASQTLHGLDLSLGYRYRLSSDSSLNLTGSAAYLKSEQRLLPNSPSQSVAGRVFNPPHWRARLGGTLTRSSMSVSLFGNYVGPVTDRTIDPVQRIGAMTTLDATVRYELRASGLLSGMSFSLSGSNLFNAKPERLRSSLLVESSYDSTNYSAIGRFISFAITKRL